MVNIGNTHRPFRPSEGKFAIDPSTMEVPASMPDTPALRKDFAAYLETVQQVDACIGGALEALRQSGRFERTYLFYTSDHGYPYLRAKASVYEEGIHVPLIITGPDIEADRSTPELVSLIDLAPTMLEIADLPVPETVQGTSLLPLLRRETETLGRKLIFAEHNAHGPGEIYPSRAVTDGRLIYLLNLMPEKRYKPPADLLPGKKWNNRAYPAYLAARDLFPLQFEALQKTLVRPEEELYDLHSDPGSLVNRVEDPRYRKHVARLRRALRQWRNHTGDVDDPGEIPTIEK
jgi:N-sulfoglucosamine sulfohydrolase